MARARVPLKRVAVVTGASSGIGAALARRLSADGWHCVLLARRRERLEALASELGAEYEVCDVSDPAAVQRAAAAVIERHPQISLLVNNAGIPGRSSFLQIEPEKIEEVMRVNYYGSIWSLAAFLPALEAARPAHVVNVVSVAGAVAYPPAGPYSASKHAQLAFSRSVAAELRPRGIRVHTIKPGFVETEGFPQRGVLGSKLMSRTVLEPEDIANRIVRAIERGEVEVFVPRWYAVPALLQALAPAVVSRAVSRAVFGRPRS